MKSNVIIVPPTGKCELANVEVNEKSIKKLLDFHDMEAMMIPYNHKLFVVYFDKAQNFFGTNIVASELIGVNIRGNCVIYRPSSKNLIPKTVSDFFN